jgi:hypothetical protein
LRTWLIPIRVKDRVRAMIMTRKLPSFRHKFLLKKKLSPSLSKSKKIW